MALPRSRRRATCQSHAEERAAVLTLSRGSATKRLPPTGDARRSPTAARNCCAVLLRRRARSTGRDRRATPNVALRKPSIRQANRIHRAATRLSPSARPRRPQTPRRSPFARPIVLDNRRSGTIIGSELTSCRRRCQPDSFHHSTAMGGSCGLHAHSAAFASMVFVHRRRGADGARPRIDTCSRTGAGRHHFRRRHRRERRGAAWRERDGDVALDRRGTGHDCQRPGLLHDPVAEARRIHVDGREQGLCRTSSCRAWSSRSVRRRGWTPR